MSIDPNERLNRLKQRANVRAFSFDGFLIACGRSALDNQVLSLGTARQGDLWFHAKGASGSHVLLFKDPGRAFTRQVIDVAATLAAFYSKNRAGGQTPVTSCDGGGVGRARGGKLGTVTIRGERLHKVRPRDPASIDGITSLN